MHYEGNKTKKFENSLGKACKLGVKFLNHMIKKRNDSITPEPIFNNLNFSTGSVPLGTCTPWCRRINIERCCQSHSLYLDIIKIKAQHLKYHYSKMNFQQSVHVPQPHRVLLYQLWYLP